jgi:hypothetical protein
VKVHLCAVSTTGKSTEMEGRVWPSGPGGGGRVSSNGREECDENVLDQRVGVVLQPYELIEPGNHTVTEVEVYGM